MNILAKGERSLRELGRLTHRLVGEKRGVAALEFALLAPLLLSMYFVTMEVGQAIETNKKIGRSASMVADLVTQQQQTTTKDDLDAILKIGRAILQPYSRSKPKIIITAIEITTDATPKVKVLWSRKMENNAFAADKAPGTITTVPPKLKIAGSFLIRVTSDINYYPVITWTAGEKTTLGLTAAFDNISMSETYYLRPRLSPQIACPTC